MVKGVSRQVIVVQSPDPKLFEQAIFILKDEAVGQGVTDEMLLKEAKRALRMPVMDSRRRKLYGYGPVWACGGAMLTAFVWLLSALI
jgi:hypothetical protein